MSSVSGLKGALKLYESEKIKDRAQGGELIREILSNRDNLLAFQETAGRDSGGGWIAFFQCLFQVVVTEKRAALKSNASAQGWSRSQIPSAIVTRRHNGVDSCDGAVRLTTL
jgi:ataxia telangiectasia mutated family protein